MSPHCPAIFLQHSRSAAVIAALGTIHAITGNPANSTARAKTLSSIDVFRVLLLQPIPVSSVTKTIGIDACSLSRFRVVLVRGGCDGKQRRSVGRCTPGG